MLKHKHFLLFKNYLGLLQCNAFMVSLFLLGKTGIVRFLCVDPIPSVCMYSFLFLACGIIPMFLKPQISRCALGFVLETPCFAVEQGNPTFLHGKRLFSLSKLI